MPSPNLDNCFYCWLSWIRCNTRYRGSNTDGPMIYSYSRTSCGSFSEVNMVCRAPPEKETLQINVFLTKINLVKQGVLGTTAHENLMITQTSSSYAVLTSQPMDCYACFGGKMKPKQDFYIKVVCCICSSQTLLIYNLSYQCTWNV